MNNTNVKKIPFQGIEVGDVNDLLKIIKEIGGITLDDVKQLMQSGTLDAILKTLSVLTTVNAQSVYADNIYFDPSVSKTKNNDNPTPIIYKDLISELSKKISNQIPSEYSGRRTAEQIFAISNTNTISIQYGLVNAENTSELNNHKAVSVIYKISENYGRIMSFVSAEGQDQEKIFIWTIANGVKRGWTQIGFTSDPNTHQIIWYEDLDVAPNTITTVDSVELEAGTYLVTGKIHGHGFPTDSSAAQAKLGLSTTTAPTTFDFLPFLNTFAEDWVSKQVTGVFKLTQKTTIYMLIFHNGDDTATVNESDLTYVRIG